MHKVPELRFPEFNGEWEESKLGNILKIKHGKNQKTIESEDGIYPILGSGGEIGRTNNYLYSKPSVLIGRKGTIDRPQYMNTPFWTIDTLFYSEINFENSSLFIYSLFQTINWLKYNQASGVPSLSASSIEAIKVNRPSLPEQEKIASFLSTLDKKIELQDKRVEKLEDNKKGIMQKVFNREIRFMDKNGREYGEWEEKKLGEIAKIYQPRTIARKDFKEGVYSVFGANGYIGYHNEFNHKLKQITVSCRGENSGNINLVQSYSWITGNSMVINIDNNYSIVNDYLYYLLSSQDLRYLVTGSGQPQITRNSLEVHSVEIPSIEEQEQIASFLSSLDTQLEIERKELELLREKKKGLLQKMFV